MYNRAKTVVNFSFVVKRYQEGKNMKTASEKIAALRAAMQQNGVDGYLVPSADPHMSEYLPDYYQTRSWLSGFDGSAGTLVVTDKHAAEAQ